LKKCPARFWTDKTKRSFLHVTRQRSVSKPEKEALDNVYTQCTRIHFHFFLTSLFPELLKKAKEQAFQQHFTGFS
jgi:hypothetical protein